MQVCAAPHVEFATHPFTGSGTSWQRPLWQLRPVPHAVAAVHACWHSPSSQIPPVPHSRSNTQWFAGTGVSSHSPLLHSSPAPQSSPVQLCGGPEPPPPPSGFPPPVVVPPSDPLDVEAGSHELRGTSHTNPVAQFELLSQNPPSAHSPLAAQ